MLSNLVQLIHVVENDECRFICNPNTKTTAIKEALYKFLGYVESVEQANKIRQHEQEKEKIDIAQDAIDPPSHRLDEV